MSSMIVDQMHGIDITKSLVFSAVCVGRTGVLIVTWAKSHLEEDGQLNLPKTHIVFETAHLLGLFKTFQAYMVGSSR